MHCFNISKPCPRPNQVVQAVSPGAGTLGLHVAWLALLTVTAFCPSTQACTLLHQQADFDRWVLLEYRQAMGGRDQAKVEFSSDPGFARDLLTCIDRGEAQLPGQSGKAYKVFRFVPARGQELAGSDRRLEYEIPRALRLGISAPSFTGTVALRVEMNEYGMIRNHDLLFSSNTWLGERILGSLDEGLKVVSRGKESGPYIDILYMRFEEGMLLNFSQTHFVDQRFRAANRAGTH